jgi:hypothetical protein
MTASGGRHLGHLFEGPTVSDEKPGKQKTRSCRSRQRWLKLRGRSQIPSQSNPPLSGRVRLSLPKAYGRQCRIGAGNRACQK